MNAHCVLICTFVTERSIRSTIGQSLVGDPFVAARRLYVLGGLLYSIVMKHGEFKNNGLFMEKCLFHIDMVGDIYTQTPHCL